jgi:hypothetical protein
LLVGHSKINETKLGGIMRRFVATTAILVFFLAISTSAQQKPIRVNCGGPSYTDSKGQVWQADTGFTGGTATSTSMKIAATPDSPLFQTARVNNTSSPVTYTFPVASGNYHVNLFFAETSRQLDSVGARVFNVQMQGIPTFTRLDIFAEAGAGTALVEGADIPVANGMVNIEFDNVMQNAKIDAIEIIPLSNATPIVALSFMYPDATPVSGTLAYSVTSSLLSYRSSLPLTNGRATCTLLGSPSDLGINTQFQVNLSLTDLAGHVLWQIALGMNPAEINFGTVQSSSLNVVVQRP